MASRRVNSSNPNASRQRPATTPEGREDQLIVYAADLAERQLRDGTASAQVITHFLSLGSSREKLNQERTRMSIEVDKVKIEAIESSAKLEERYVAAIQAMRGYSGQDPLEIEE